MNYYNHQKVFIYFISAIVFIVLFRSIIKVSPNSRAVILGVSTFNPQLIKTSLTKESSNILEETGIMSQSKSADWWLNSGGKLLLNEMGFKTIQGELLSKDKWFQLYKSSNYQDTDGGTHPQNIFRLVRRHKLQNFEQQVTFKINKLNLGSSQNRNASNGVLLFNRYQDGDNLYYTGIRVDGLLVIKKKYGGKYSTLATKQYVTYKYNKSNNPNSIPLEKWIGIKSIVKTENNITKISLYTKDLTSNDWSLSLEAIDDGKKYGSPMINSAGYAGIRTDFMDVEFKDYEIKSL